MYGQLNLLVDASFDLSEITGFHIRQRPNEHGVMELSGIIKDGIGFVPTLNSRCGERISLSLDSGERLFCGIITHITCQNEGQLFTVILQDKAATILLDEQLRRRTFQDKSMSYAEVQRRMLTEYGNAQIIPTVNTQREIPAPLLQYDETDWKHFERQASHFNTVLYSDILSEEPRLWFGFPNGLNSITVEDEIPYLIDKDCRLLRRARYHEAKVSDQDFALYCITVDESYEIGDQVQFLNQTLFVGERDIFLEGAVVRYAYKLMRKNYVFEPKAYNEKAFGLELTGNVLDTKGEAVKVHFHIDKEQAIEEAFWFPFAPPTGSLMYCMPQHGTQVIVTFPELREQQAQAWGCKRSNGQTCPKTSNPDNRYLGTEHGSEMEMTPTSMHFWQLEKTQGGLAMELADATGVHVDSNTTFEIDGKEGVHFISATTITAIAPAVYTSSTQGGSVDVDANVNVIAPDTRLEGNSTAVIAIPSILGGGK